MFTLPNLLSLSRFPLALTFLWGTPSVRIISIFLAFLTDVFDGFLARKLKLSSRVGVWLDPLADKFFVVTAITALYQENPLDVWKIAAIFCRDLSIIIFAGYLTVRGDLSSYYPRAIWSGKVSTGLQLIVLFALTAHFALPDFVFISFYVFGTLALAELYITKKHVPIIQEEIP